jgi:hypothetical protein
MVSLNLIAIPGGSWLELVRILVWYEQLCECSFRFCSELLAQRCWHFAWHFGLFMSYFLKIWLVQRCLPREVGFLYIGTSSGTNRLDLALWFLTKT